MRMFLIVTAVCVLFAGISVKAFGAVVNDFSKMVSVNLKEGWTVEKQTKDELLTAYAPESTANVMFFTEAVKKATLVQCEKAWTQGVAELQDYKLISRTTSKLGGNPSIVMLFSATIGAEGEQCTVKFKHVFVVRGGYLRVFQLAVQQDNFDEWVDDFDALMKTVKWLK